MTPLRVQVKVFFALPDGFEVARVVPLFHRWIQEGYTDELLLDVADYRHVHRGPGILLVGHEADYVVDAAGGRYGLRYVRKRAIHDSLAGALAQATRAALQGARMLGEDLGGAGLEVIPGEFEVVVPDPLRYPNEEATLRRVAPDVERVFGTDVVLARTMHDVRLPFTLRLDAPSAVDTASFEIVVGELEAELAPSPELAEDRHASA